VYNPPGTKKFGELYLAYYKVLFAYFNVPKIGSVRLFRQLQTSIAHISRMDRDINKRKTVFSTTIYSTSIAKKLGKLRFINNKVLLSYFEPPKFDIALAT